ncbi:MAG: hypothetical protein JXR94_23025 [Candidatus Hydrogenedentes bacterium]|nr:hypothetical protein [Candidatus Hydrogenedentota bacterium]
MIGVFAMGIAELLVLIPIVVIFGAMILAVGALLRGSRRHGGPELRAEETRTIQEIHSGLARMEERVEALETLLLDRERKAETR